MKAYLTYEQLASRYPALLQWYRDTEDFESEGYLTAEESLREKLEMKEILTWEEEGGTLCWHCINTYGPNTFSRWDGKTLVLIDE